MSQTSKTALIVDDEETLRYALSRQLEQFGYECLAVSNGPEALAAAARLDFDLMMLDIRMPGMSGLQVLKDFRANHPQTCVIMLSAIGDSAISTDALKSGADDYIIKPCHPHELRMRLRWAIARRDRAWQVKSPSPL